MIENQTINNRSQKVDWLRTVIMNTPIFIVEYIIGILVISIIDAYIFDVKIGRTLVYLIDSQGSVITFLFVQFFAFPVIFIILFNLILLMFGKNTFKKYNYKY